jgi:hypothetical protein
MTRKKNQAQIIDITTAIEETKKVIKKAKSNSKTEFPKVVEGTHLKVYTYIDGSTKLEWDDEQLLKEVREAIASVKKPAVRAKANKKVPVTKKTVTKKKA